MVLRMTRLVKRASSAGEANLGTPCKTTACRLHEKLVIAGHHGMPARTKCTCVLWSKFGLCNIKAEGHLKFPAGLASLPWTIEQAAEPDEASILQQTGHQRRNCRGKQDLAHTA